MACGILKGSTPHANVLFQVAGNNLRNRMLVCPLQGGGAVLFHLLRWNGKAPAPPAAEALLENFLEAAAAPLPSGGGGQAPLSPRGEPPCRGIVLPRIGPQPPSWGHQPWWQTEGKWRAEEEKDPYTWVLSGTFSWGKTSGWGLIWAEVPTEFSGVYCM